MESTKDETGNTVIIGIDFGTTFSGVAYTWSKKIERMEVISSWDAEFHSSSDEEKTPTAISFGPKKRVTWGYNIPYEAEQARWFKLLLIDDKDLPEEVQGSTRIKEARAYLRKHNKEPIAVIANFLRLLWNHCNQRITETVSRNLVNYSKFHIIITLPAIWPDYARRRMEEAASQAGMLAKRVAGDTQLSFISEPEAAAVATLSDMDGRCDIKAGDSFVVVDCGGGTVDLISYEVVSTTPMAVKECVKGQGGLCGAVFVDEAFLKLLEAKFGEEAWAKMEPQSRRRFVHDDWEHGIKPTFDGRERTWVLNMPFECIDLSKMKGGFRLPTITLTANDVRSVFDPTVSKIRVMVDDQVAAVKTKKAIKPKYVIMAGGFGRCKYLFAALKQHFGDEIEVLQSRGSGPWTAICRGAVIHAASVQGLPTFSVDIQTRVARASYGLMWNTPWRQGKHDARDKFWNEDRQRWQARHQMKWFLKIGDDMSTSKPVRFTISRLYKADEASNIRCTETIYTSTSNPSPKRWEDNVEELCTIKWETKIDISSLPTFTNCLGKVFYELLADVEMTCTGGSLDFAIYHDGKRQGSKNMAVDYETRS